ncbi:MAG: DUF6268 family outer membrane beta-barrel protein [Phycisphaerales bacterium]
MNQPTLTLCGGTLLGCAALALGPAAMGADERAAVDPALSIQPLALQPEATGAAPPTADAPADPAPRAWTFEVRGAGSYTFAADIDDSPGDVRIARAGFGVGVGIPIGDRSTLTFDIDEEASWYLFDNAGGLVPGSTDPVELVLSTDLGLRFSSRINPEWSWFLGGLAEFAGEPDVDVGDAATFGGYGGVRYQVSERFAVSAGLGAKSRLEDDALVIPVLGVDWQITDRVSLKTEGTRVRLSAKLSETLAVSLAGGWELREFRLRDDGPLPDGVFRDTRVPISISLDFRPSHAVRISVFGGVVVWQEFRFDDRSGDEVSETNTDPAPFIGISAAFSF